MMDKKPKKGLLILLKSKLEEKKKEGDKEKYEAMGKELLSAIADEDAGKFAMSLKDFIEYCQMEKEKDKDSDY